MRLTCYTKTLSLLMLAMAMVSLFPACSQETQSFQQRIEDLYSYEVPLIKPAELKQKLAKQDSIYLLDTRTPAEYKVSCLRHSQRIGYDDFRKEKIAHIPKEATVVTYCTVGYRSDKIGERLKAMGYENVYNLYGSMISWVNAGYPVYTPEGSPTRKVHTHSEDWSQYLEKGQAVYE